MPAEKNQGDSSGPIAFVYRFYSVRLLIFIFFSASFVSASAAELNLADVPFWKTNTGWWASDNTYFDGELNYNIRSYNSIVHIEINGRSMLQTEHKFYPPGKMALNYGAEKIGVNDGIEVVTVMKAEQIDAAGTVQITQVAPQFGTLLEASIHVLGPDTAVQIFSDSKSAVDSYRMFITIPAPDKRYIANFGLVSEVAPDASAVGDLRGFSLFKGTRIRADDFEQKRSELRLKNHVRAVMTAGTDNEPVIQILD